MPGNRFDTPLTDLAIDREIEAALAVDPSPEFLARVRGRLANEPAPATWRFGWVPVAVCTAVPLVVVLVVAVVRPEHKVGPATMQRSVIPATPIAVASFTSAPTVPARHVIASPPRVRSSPESRVPNPESRILSPEVLVSRAESEALWRAVVSAREGRVVFTSALADVSNAGIDGDVQPPPEITIAPISVEPIVREPSKEGVRQ